jgi:hypothetical protein
MAVHTPSKRGLCILWQALEAALDAQNQEHMQELQNKRHEVREEEVQHAEAWKQIIDATRQEHAEVMAAKAKEHEDALKELVEVRTQYNLVSTFYIGARPHPHPSSPPPPVVEQG